jgi:hypothetical protein
MDLEFEMDFRQHPAHRLIEFAVLGVLTIGDAYLILKVWRAIRKSWHDRPAWCLGNSAIGNLTFTGPDAAVRNIYGAYSYARI